MYIRIVFSIELRLRLSRSLRSLANNTVSRMRQRVTGLILSVDQISAVAWFLNLE